METKEIINPIAKRLLLLELENKANFVKYVERSAVKDEGKVYKIYTFTAIDCPYLMMEVGRLREITFRIAGGGTRRKTDIDHFDILNDNEQSIKKGFFQLIVWDPEAKEIVGGYRYAKMGDLIDKDNEIDSPSSKLFDFSQQFVEEYANITIELGRSFVQPIYQCGMFCLENLFEGLGTISVDNPDIQYFFGKVTMYKTYNREARNMILYYLEKYCKDKENLLSAKLKLIPEGLNQNIEFLEKLFENNPTKRDLRLLKLAVNSIKEEKVRIPAFFKYYYDLSDTMQFFGTAINKDFGEVEETAIMVKIADIKPEKRARYLDPYINKVKNRFKKE